MDYCARLSTLEENCRFLNSESPYHSETLVRGRLVVKSRFGDDSKTEWAARRQVRAEVGARVSYATHRRKYRMQIRKLITGTLFTAIVLIARNASAQLPFPPPPPGSTAPPARNIQAEVAQMTQRYGLSEDQATKVTTILQEETKKSDEVLKSQSLSPEERLNKLQSLKQEEISRVSDVLTPEQKQKYQADLQPTPPAQSPASGAAPGLQNLPSNQ